MQNFEKTETLTFIAFWSFLLLYPVFFWYHALLFYGLLPEVVQFTLRGWYGPVCVLCIFLFTLNLKDLLQQTKIKQDWISIIFFCYVLWCLIWSGTQIVFFPKEYTVEGAQKLFLSLTLQIANFFVGSLLVLSNKTGKIAVLLFAWLSISIFCLVVYEPTHGSVYHSLISTTELAILRADILNFSSYQGLARSFLMTSLLLIALINVRFIYLVVCLLSLITLMLIGARSELMGFVCAIAIFEITNLRSIKIKPSDLLIGIIGVSVTLYALYLWLGEHFERVRTFNFFNLYSDPSVNTRLGQLSDAISLILERPISGDFAVHLKLGNHGDMPHNILSAWTMLGLPGFLLIFLLIVGSCHAAFRAVFIQKSHSATWKYSLLLATMACPQLLISKSAFVEWLPLLFGSVVAARSVDPTILNSPRETQS